MTIKSFFACLFLATSVTGTAEAQSVFDVSLGGKKLGTLSYGGSKSNETMNTTLSNTPLGVFNGTMNASSKAAGGTRTFKANTGAERKKRTVIVSHQAGRALETMVDPAAQITPLSDPARVPAGIVDPVQAIGKLVNAKDCPAKITIYDGRRAVALTPTKASIEEGMQTCQMSYRVVAGPPHLSPLNVSKAKMKLVYSTGDAPRQLVRLEVSHGIFKVKLQRQN